MSRIDLLPRSYRSWVPGAARVLAALLITMGVAALLRSFPEGQASAVAATTGSATVPGNGGATRIAATPTGVTGSGSGFVTRTRHAASGALVARVPQTRLVMPRDDGAPPDLQVILLAPAAARSPLAGSPVGLSAQVRGVGGDTGVRVDLVWAVTRLTARPRVVFRARGADAVIPAGLLTPGRYRVTVVARAGISRALATTALVVSGPRSDGASRSGLTAPSGTSDHRPGGDAMPPGGTGPAGGTTPRATTGRGDGALPRGGSGRGVLPSPGAGPEGNR